MVIPKIRIRKLFDNPFVWRPLVVFLGPLPILIFLWVFFAVTFIRPLALPDYLVPLVQAHFQTTTLILSIFATIIAAWVSFFFSLAIRYVIAIRLATTPTPLDVLTSATRIAQQTFWLHDPREKWTWIVLLAYMGITVQTSGLIAFLNVREIEFSYGLTGKDLNLTDSQWLQLSRQITLIPPPSNALASLFLQGAMMDAMLGRKNVPSTFNLNGYTFLTTTGGIYPATCVPIDNHDQYFTNNPNLVVPGNLKDLSKSKHSTLPYNKSMELAQQGFTAEVNCRISDPRDNATYRPALTSQEIDDNGLTMALLNATCPDMSPGTTQAVSASYNITDSFATGGILAVACPIPHTNNYDIIIKGTGWYDSILDFTTCTVSPKVTFVNVTYVLPPENSTVPTAVRVSVPINQTEVPVWGRSAVDMLLYSIYSSQSTRGSNLGMAFFSGWTRDPNNATANAMFANAMTTYIRAAVEFSGTVIRVLWTQSPGYLAKMGVNSSVYMPIEGTYFAMTYGWHQSHGISPLFLLPTTAVIISTYIVLIYGVIYARKHKADIHTDDLRFDPTDIVHIIAAHAPETRLNEFKNFSYRLTSYMRRTMVQIQSIRGIRAFTVSVRPINANDPQHHRDRQPLMGGDPEPDDLESERDGLIGGTARNTSSVISGRVSGSTIVNPAETLQGSGLDFLPLDIDLDLGLDINLSPDTEHE